VARNNLLANDSSIPESSGELWEDLGTTLNDLKSNKTLREKVKYFILLVSQFATFLFYVLFRTIFNAVFSCLDRINLEVSRLYSRFFKQLAEPDDLLCLISFSLSIIFLSLIIAITTLFIFSIVFYLLFCCAFVMFEIFSFLLPRFIFDFLRSIFGDNLGLVLILDSLVQWLKEKAYSLNGVIFLFKSVLYIAY
jgi:hypothetical protein